jgi:hypothetical protein
MLLKERREDQQDPHLRSEEERKIPVKGPKKCKRY